MTSHGRKSIPQVVFDQELFLDKDAEAVLEIDRLFWIDPNQSRTMQYERLFVPGEARPQTFADGANEKGIPLTKVRVFRWGREILSLRRQSRDGTWRYTPVLHIIDNPKALPPKRSHKKVDRKKVDKKHANHKESVKDFRVTLAGILNSFRKGTKKVTPERKAELDARSVEIQKRRAGERLTRRIEIGRSKLSRSQGEQMNQRSVQIQQEKAEEKKQRRQQTQEAKSR